VAPRRFCSADEDKAPFGADGVWLPLAVEAVSATLRFLPFEVPFAALVPLAAGVVDAEAAADALFVCWSLVPFCCLLSSGSGFLEDPLPERGAGCDELADAVVDDDAACCLPLDFLESSSFRWGYASKMSKSRSLSSA
jgi:hypothetical protein